VSSSTRLLVLGVVRIFQPVHGYDVRRELLSWRAEEWANVAPGSIYNALNSLTRDGLIERVGTKAVGGRPERTSYQLTADGEKEFQRLLRETWWRLDDPIDPLAPAIAFMWAMTRDELIAAIRHRLAQIHGRQQADEYAIRDYDDPDSRDQVRLMVGLGAARRAAEIAWAETLLAALERGEYTFADERKPAPAKADRPRRRGGAKKRA